MPDASKTSSPNWRSHQCTPSNRPRKHTRGAIPQAQRLPASTRPKPTSTAPGGFGGLTSLQKSRTQSKYPEGRGPTADDLDLVSTAQPVFAQRCDGHSCLLYTSDAADEEDSVDLG